MESGREESRWLRPLLAVLVGLVALIVLLFAGNAIANARSGGEAWGLGPQSEFGLDGWVTWTIVGAVVAYGVYVGFADKPIWQVGTREVVYMAIGSVLYGVLSWATNVSTIVVPSVSLVSLRPAIAIPPLFGFLFGPVVGFFTGAFGNVLGDAISGWGVFPAWDIGNGLIGMIPGLLMAFPEKKRALGTVTWFTAGLTALVALFSLVAGGGEFENPITGEFADHGAFWWVLLVGAVIVLAARYLLADRPEAATAAVWSSLGVVVGIGFASIADIWINGYSFTVAILGEFVPAAGPNIIFVVVLVPILLAAYRAATARGGR